MGLMFEVLMSILLDAAALMLVLRLLRLEGEEKKKYRLLSVTFSLGFLFGVIEKCASGGSYAVMLLFALGFMLSYEAFIFTFPEKRKQNVRH